MKYEPDSVWRRDSVAMLSATNRMPTVAIRKPSHDPLPARPATTAMLRAGVSVGAMFATDWPMQSTRPSALARNWGRSAALASAPLSPAGPGGVIRVRMPADGWVRQSRRFAAHEPIEFFRPPTPIVEELDWPGNDAARFTASPAARAPAPRSPASPRQAQAPRRRTPSLRHSR